jgi:hypothetical protein
MRCNGQGTRCSGQPTLPYISPIQPFFGFEGGFGGTTSRFDVSPSFNATGTGGVGGISAGFLTPLPGTNLLVGPRVGFLGGNLGGSVSNPVASPFFTYDTRTNEAVTWEAMFNVGANNLNRFGDVTVAAFGGWMYASFQQGLTQSGSSSLITGANLTNWRQWVMGLSFGGVTANTQVNGTSGAFNVSDSVTRTGFTAALNAQYLMTGQLAATANLRYIYLPYRTVNIPGSVAVNEQKFLFTVGLNVYPLGPTSR